MRWRGPQGERRGAKAGLNGHIMTKGTGIGTQLIFITYYIQVLHPPPPSYPSSPTQVNLVFQEESRLKQWPCPLFIRHSTVWQEDGITSPEQSEKNIFCSFSSLIWSEKGRIFNQSAWFHRKYSIIVYEYECNLICLNQNKLCGLKQGIYVL